MRYIKHTTFVISIFLFMGNTLLFNVPTLYPSLPEILSSREISLNDRAMPGSYMNEVMKDNILLTLAYMRGMPISASPDWEDVRKPFTYSFELKPGETFAFQKDSLPEFAGSVVKTINVNFAAQDGFKHDGYLMGDGVCHLASLFYWAALDAGLTTVAPTNHNFMPIPEIPREYGVAIYSMPGQTETNAKQNLYVKNNTENIIKFEIKYDGNNLTSEVLKNPAVSSPSLINSEII